MYFFLSFIDIVFIINVILFRNEQDNSINLVFQYLKKFANISNIFNMKKLFSRNYSLYVYMYVCADKDLDQKETEIDKDILDDCNEYVEANKILRKNFENQLKGIKNRIKISLFYAYV